MIYNTKNVSIAGNQWVYSLSIIEASLLLSLCLLHLLLWLEQKLCC